MVSAPTPRITGISGVIRSSKISVGLFSYTQGRVQRFAWGGCEAPRKFSTPPHIIFYPPRQSVDGGGRHVYTKMTGVVKGNTYPINLTDSKLYILTHKN